VLAARKVGGGLFDVTWACKWQWGLVALACFTVLLVVPFFDQEHQRAQRCLAMLVFVTILWVTGMLGDGSRLRAMQRCLTNCSRRQCLVRTPALACTNASH
jgi:nitrate/nitrite transporter NarK